MWIARMKTLKTFVWIRPRIQPQKSIPIDNINTGQGARMAGYFILTPMFKILFSSVNQAKSESFPIGPWSAIQRTQRKPKQRAGKGGVMISTVMEVM
jgi:hypothetical protein